MNLEDSAVLDCHSNNPNSNQINTKTCLKYISLWGILVDMRDSCSLVVVLCKCFSTETMALKYQLYLHMFCCTVNFKMKTAKWTPIITNCVMCDLLGTGTNNWYDINKCSTCLLPLRAPTQTICGALFCCNMGWSSSERTKISWTNVRTR